MPCLTNRLIRPSQKRLCCCICTEWSPSPWKNTSTGRQFECGYASNIELLPYADASLTATESTFPLLRPVLNCPRSIVANNGSSLLRAVIIGTRRDVHPSPYLTAVIGVTLLHNSSVSARLIDYDSTDAPHIGYLPFTYCTDKVDRYGHPIPPRDAALYDVYYSRCQW